MREDYVEVGYIAKAHGVRGEVKAVFDVHDLSKYLSRKEFWLAKKNHHLEKYEVERLKSVDKGVIIKFKGILDRDQAEAITGATLFIPDSDLPLLPDGQFYYFEVLGFLIEDKNLGKLGVLEDILETGSHDIFVMRYKEKEVLIPSAEEIILYADKSEKILYTHLPEGLLELYMDEETGDRTK